LYEKTGIYQKEAGVGPFFNISIYVQWYVHFWLGSLTATLS